MLAFLIGVSLLTGVGQLPAEAAVQGSARDCRDDRGADRCTAEQLRRDLAVYGLEPIEAHRDRGDQVRRVLFVDGYGRDMVAVTFNRAPGRDPTLLVHFPRAEGQPPRPPSEALVPGETWQQVLQRGQHFDRQLVPVQGPNPIEICMHSWIYRVEASDPASPPGRPAAARQIVESACARGLAQPYAGFLAETALGLLPYCAALDRELHRNAASQLRDCGLLEGDRMAAAEALNQIDRLKRADRPEDAALGRSSFDWRAQLDWAGEQFGGDGGQAYGAWLERTTGDRRANLYVRRVIGERADRVRVEAWLARREERPGTGEVSLEAPVEFVLTSSSFDSGLRVERVTVGAFQPSRQ